MALPEAEALNNIGGMVRYMPWDGCPRSEYEYGLLVNVVPGEGRAFVRFHLGDTVASCMLDQLDIIVHPVQASWVGRPCRVLSSPGKVIAQSGHGTDGGAAMYQVHFEDLSFGWFPAMDVTFDPEPPLLRASLGQMVMVNGQRGTVVDTEESHEGNITEYRVKFEDGSDRLCLAHELRLL